MAGTGTAAAGNSVRIQRSFDFLSESFLTEIGGNPLGLDIDIQAPRSQELALALAQNKPFPFARFQGGNIDLSDLQADLGTGVRLGPANAEVSFGASARIGVYRDSAALRKALGGGDRVTAALPGKLDDHSCYVLVKLGYDARGAVNGAVALGGGAAATFGVEASRDVGYAIVRRLQKSTGSRSALAAAFQSWMLPSQFRGVEHLSGNHIAPGTWLIAEVDGSFAVKLGAKFGYDLNWLRKTSLGELKGDIGLKVQLAVSAAVGFHASGRYVMVLGREDETERVRLALLKERKKGWDFALNAAATVQAQLPAGVAKLSALNFVAAVTGTNGAQLVEDLKEIRDWTDPKTKLEDKLAGFLLDVGTKQLASAGVNPAQILEHAHGHVSQFLKKWEALPHETAAALWSAVDEVAGDPTRAKLFRDWLAAVATEGDLRSAIGEQLARVEFLRTPEGRFIESMAVPGLLAVLNNNEQAKRVREAAAVARDILDGGVLRELREYVNDHLNLERLVDISDPDKLDPWLRAKLADLLEKPIDAAGLNEARAAIHTLFEKADEIWQAALKAGTRKYNFSLAAGYQSTETRGALLDIEVDLSGGDLTATSLLRAAIDGDFERVLLEANDRVRLHEAELTHGVKRQSWVEVTLPWSTSKAVHLNESLARLRAADDGSRVLVYELTSTDEVKELHKGRSARDSRLAVGMRLAAEAGGAVRRFSEGSFTYSYSLRQANRELRKSQARMQLVTYTRTYFPDAFTGPPKETLETWVDDLDRIIDDIEHNGTNNFGNTVLDLEVSLPGAAVAAWFQAPQDKKAPVYLDMSRRIQQKLKEVTASYYLSDPDVYRRDLLAIRPLLVYAAMPPSTAIRMKSDGVTLDSINDAKDIYWDVFDVSKIRAMARSGRTRVNLEAQMARAAALLREIPELSSEAKFYDATPGNVMSVLETALQPASAGDPRPALLGSLLRFEALVVEGARKAGLEVAAFRKAAGQKELKKALEALEEFGAKLTETFHASIAPIYGGGAVRALGTMVFVEAALALADPADRWLPSAMLTLSVYPKSWAGFNPELFATEGIDNAPQPIVQERLVRLA